MTQRHVVRKLHAPPFSLPIVVLAAAAYRAFLRASHAIGFAALDAMPLTMNWRLRETR